LLLSAAIEESNRLVSDIPETRRYIRFFENETFWLLLVFLEGQNESLYHRLAPLALNREDDHRLVGLVHRAPLWKRTLPFLALPRFGRSWNFPLFEKFHQKSESTVRSRASLSGGPAFFLVW
jgi:hypothetical protein